MKVMHTQVLCTNSLPKFDVDDAAMRCHLTGRF